MVHCFDGSRLYGVMGQKTNYAVEFEGAPTLPSWALIGHYGMKLVKFVLAGTQGLAYFMIYSIFRPVFSIGKL